MKMSIMSNRMWKGIGMGPSGLAIAMVLGGLPLSVHAAQPVADAGYLKSRGPNQGKIRLMAPPKPQIPSLPPLPQTYVPEPQHTAEFIAQLHATSAQFSTNFSVRAQTPDPVYLGNLVPPVANTVTAPLAPVEATGQTEAILGYFSGGLGTNGVPVLPGTGGAGPIMPIVLPLNGLLQPQPPAVGTSKATYELR